MQSSITRHLPCPIQTQLQLQLELQKLKLKQNQEPFRPCRSRRNKQIKGGLSSFHLVGWRVSPLPSALSPFSNTVQYEPFLWPSLSWRFSSVVAFPFPCSCLRDLPCEIWTHIEVGQGFSSGCDFRFPARPMSDDFCIRSWMVHSTLVCVFDLLSLPLAAAKANPAKQWNRASAAAAAVSTAAAAGANCQLLL